MFKQSELVVHGRTAEPSEGPDLLTRFFAEFLDETTFSEFRRIERLFANLRGQGSTISGYPIIRPTDCAQITKSLTELFGKAKAQFLTRDPILTERFEELISKFHSFCRSVYPSEATAALLLHGKVLLFMGRAGQVIDLVSHLALRPYAVENNVRHCSRLMVLFAKAHLLQGTLWPAHMTYVAVAAWLAARSNASSMCRIARIMAPFICHDSVGPGARLRAGMIQWAARGYMRAKRGHVGAWPNVAAFLMRRLYHGLMVLGYLALRRRARTGSPFSLSMNPRGTTLVTRAMGGIGDILMLAPGLEALAKRQKAPVDLAIPRKFFPIFRSQPARAAD